MVVFQYVSLSSNPFPLCMHFASEKKHRRRSWGKAGGFFGAEGGTSDLAANQNRYETINGRTLALKMTRDGCVCGKMVGIIGWTGCVCVFGRKRPRAPFGRWLQPATPYPGD